MTETKEKHLRGSFKMLPLIFYKDLQNWILLQNTVDL